MSQNSPAHQNITRCPCSFRPIDWRKVARIMLQAALPISAMSSHPEERRSNDEAWQIPLNIIKFPFPSYSINGAELSRDSTTVMRDNDSYTATQLFESLFFQKSTSTNNQRKIAIIGESGSGKTLTLQKIAHWLLEKTDNIPIWISPHQLKTATVKDYLLEQWLTQVIERYHPITSMSETAWRNAFEQFVKSGKIWLLLDGVDHLWTDDTVNRDHPSPLALLLRQRQNLIGNVSLILTCQTQTWENESNALSNFEIYQTQPLNDENQIEQFIKQWFHLHRHTSDSPSVSNADTAQQLFDTLKKPEHQHLQQWLKNSLRLALLCRLWQKQANSFSFISSWQLYQKLVDEFYQWQAETVSITSEQVQQLNQWLANLALKHQETTAATNSCRQFTQNSQRPSPSILQETLRENPELLSLAVQLQWLKPMGVTEVKRPSHDLMIEQNSGHYAFCDPTFQDYFAALAIDHWQYFWDQDRILSFFSNPSWQRILRFWLGRDDIATEQKEALIHSLIHFEDGCNPFNFYGTRAYLIAAASLSEFPQCTLAQTIVQQILTWSLTEHDISRLNLRVLAAKKTLKTLYRPLAVTAVLDLICQNQDESLQQQGLQILKQIGKNNEVAITTLSQYLTELSSPVLTCQVAETLGTIDPGNLQAIAVFVALLTQTTSDTIRQLAFTGLENIGQGNQQAIQALVQLLYTQSTPSVQRRAFQCLEAIGQGNAMAIAILVQLIRTTQGIGLQRQAAETLEKIDPGNPTALAILIRLTAATTPEVVRQEAVYSLGEVSLGNSQAIAALVKLLQETDNTYIRWIAISSLGKLGVGNELAIAALEKFIHSHESLLLQKEALDSLGKIDPQNPAIIRVATTLMQTVSDEATRREIAETLGKLDPGNPTAINVLTQILQTSTDEFTCRRTAASLGDIDPGNLEALNALIRLIQKTRDADLRSLAAESLGKVGVGNPAAIATLMRLLETSNALESCRCAAKSLSKIAPGHKEAIAALVKRLLRTSDYTLGLQLAESLIQMMSHSQMNQVIIQLRDHLYQDPNPTTSPCYQVLWHCAQTLSYQAFTQAWHQRELFNQTIPVNAMSSTPVVAPLTFVEQIEQEIQNQPQFEPIRLIWIDVSQFIDRENPAIDIYDQMLAQHCKSFQHGLPETMAKLRLYWHLLQRETSEKKLILLFHQGSDTTQTTPLSPHLIETLSKFRGAIAVISHSYSAVQRRSLRMTVGQQSFVGLPVFSPEEPQSVPTLLAWIESNNHYKMPTKCKGP